jgi:hypothetical protein
MFGPHYSFRGEGTSAVSHGENSMAYAYGRNGLERSETLFVVSAGKRSPFMRRKSKDSRQIALGHS